MIQLAKTTDKTRAAGRAPQGANHSLGRSSPRESLSRVTFGSRHLVKSRVSFNGLWPERLRHCVKDVTNTVLGNAFGLILDPWDS